ncbi:MAG: MFS transporter, partial [Archangium sp.]|nr:MFS transporter [Archangium sp.]
MNKPKGVEDKASPPGATYAVFILTVMNLLNYADRYAPSAIKDLYKKDLQLSDLQTSLPLTAFVVVYLGASPLFGALADRLSRTRLIAIGVGLWSLATAAAAAATGFATFFIARAAVGIGEAAYATLAPPLLSDFYSRKRRNRALSFFYVAVPIGAAVGYSASAWVGHHHGWRMAFLLAGLPGLLIAGLALKIKEPPRGYFDRERREHTESWGKAIRALAKNHTFLAATAGYTAVLFASGAISDWFPTYLERDRGFALPEAGTIVGVVTVTCGITGTFVGSWAADKLIGKTSHPYLAFSGLAMIPATICAAMTLLIPGK